MKRRNFIKLFSIMLILNIINFKFRKKDKKKFVFKSNWLIKEDDLI